MGSTPIWTTNQCKQKDMEKKYKLTNETINLGNRMLYKIEVVRNFNNDIL